MQDNNQSIIESVQVNELAPNEDFNELSLVEIKDEKVINRIVSAIPGMAQLVTNAAAASQAASVAGKGIYQAILPSGASLAKSQATKDAVRGFYQEGGKIAGQAEFMAVDGMVEKIAAVNAVNAAMGAASMVVGQYYMKQINAELGQITVGISKLEDFHKNEYKSKVLTLCTQVKRAADFQVEILEDSSLRNEEISRLQSLETTCMDLLNQANLMVEHITSKKCEDFPKYSKATNEISEWQKYQTVLTNVLFTIADLNYTFHLGALSPEQCYSAYETCFKYTEKVIGNTKGWHIKHGKSLGVNEDYASVRRDGIDAVVHKPLELINKKYKYKSMKKAEVEQIRVQKAVQVDNRRFENKNLFMKDVQVIFKEGKVYYLPE